MLSSQFRTIGNVQNILDSAAVLAVVTCGITFVLLMGVHRPVGRPASWRRPPSRVALLVANNRNDNDLGFLGIAGRDRPGRRARPA